jgi:cation diffusion facilitator family transporter
VSQAHRFSCPHDHDFLSEQHGTNERRTLLVLALTLITMVVEIVAGFYFGSMALLADGWHMASHASAMGVAALAYYLSRKHRHNRRFSFGTGKINDLAAYSSALQLALIALFMAYESIKRLYRPVAIHYDEAIAVALLGLIVNLVCAWILKEKHLHHDHRNAGHNHHDHDHNLRAAYLHVLADAATSILAIAALTGGKFYGWNVLDPLMGIAGAALISRWSYGLLRDTGRVLLDISGNSRLVKEIEDILKASGALAIHDLHLWRVGQGSYSATVSLSAARGARPDRFKRALCALGELSHVTVEVNTPSDTE